LSAKAISKRKRIRFSAIFRRRWLLSDARRAISRSSPSSCATWASLQPIAAPAIASSRR
jgi:hypothetical protein